MDNVWFRREQLFNCLDRRGYVSWRKRRICMTDYGKISFYVLTYNVAEAKNMAQNPLSGLIQPGKQLYAISLYEVSMNVTTILSSESKLTQVWLDYITEALPYYSMAYRYIGGLVLVICTRAPLVVEALCDESFGLMNGLIANKGSIMASIRCENTRYLFIGCHLSASRKPDGMLARLDNIQQAIYQCGYLTLTKLVEPVSPGVDAIYSFLCDYSREEYADYRTTGVPQSLYNYDVVFLFGDLNFRLYMHIYYQFGLIQQGRFHELLERDELSWLVKGCDYYRYADEGETPPKNYWPEYMSSDSTVEISSPKDSKYLTKLVKEGQCRIKVTKSPLLSLFKEEKIAFPPTYKIRDGYYKADRNPAYCDRILYMQVNDDINVEVHAYSADFSVDISDHKPVTMAGQLACRPAGEYLEQVSGRANAEWDELVRLLRPRIELGGCPVVISSIKYGERVAGSIAITNRHGFSAVSIVVKNQNSFIHFSQDSVVVPAGATLELGFAVQVLSRSVLPGSYRVAVYSVNGLVQLCFDIEIGHIDASILEKNAYNRAVVGIGELIINGAPSGHQCDDTKMYDQILSGEVKIQVPFYRAMEALLNYLYNTSILSDEYAQELQRYVANKSIVGSEDLICYLEDYLAPEYHEIVYYCMGLLNYVSYREQYYPRAYDLSEYCQALFKTHDQKTIQIVVGAVLNWGD